MTYDSAVPLLAVLVSLAAVPLVLVSSRSPRLRESWTIGAALVQFGLVISLLPRILDGRIAETHIGELVPGFDLALRVDPLGMVFALVASTLWVLTSFYSIGYVRAAHEHKQTRYFAAFALCLSATIGVAFSANLITFIVFYEILTIATYPLVIHKETPEAIRAGRKYLAYTLTAGVALLAGAVWLSRTAGTLDFTAGGVFGGVDAGSGTVRGLFALLVGGVAVKAAIVPLHAWLPAAMVAPTPVSALLHAVAVVKSGVFGVLRVTGFVFGPTVMEDHGLALPLAIVAGATIVLGSLAALAQDNLKRRLAYSTIGHLSYIVLAAALVHPDAFVGGILHITTHATMKITLFFVAGAIYVHAHRDRVSELDGIGREMPWTMGAFALASIGLAGLPPVNGFESKWFIGAGAAASGQELALVVLLLSGVLNAAYLLPIVHRAFLRPSTQHHGLGEAPALVRVPLMVTAATSLVFGVFPNALVRFYDLARMSADAVFGGVG